MLSVNTMTLPEAAAVFNRLLKEPREIHIVPLIISSKKQKNTYAVILWNMLETEVDTILADFDIIKS